MPLYNPLAITADLLATPDGTYDIGASGATRPRDIYVADDVVAGGDVVAGTGVSTGQVSCDSILVSGTSTFEDAMGAFTINTSSYVGFAQIADPGAPTANTISVHARDNGGSSTLGLRCEQAVASEAVVSDRTLTVYINNVALKILLKA
jgi:hypothetical protein